MAVASEFFCGSFNAVAFSLDKLGHPNLSLKEEQISAMKAAYSELDVFVCLPNG